MVFLTPSRVPSGENKKITDTTKAVSVILARPKCFVPIGSLISSMSFGTVNEGGGTRRAKNAALRRFLNALSSPFGRKQKNNGHHKSGIRYFGAPEGTRTPDLLIRSQALYPAELRAHVDNEIDYSGFARKSQGLFLKIFLAPCK